MWVVVLDGGGGVDGHKVAIVVMLVVMSCCGHGLSSWPSS